MMTLSLPRKLDESEIEDMLAALRQGEELHLDRRFSHEASKLTMVLEEDAVRLEDRIGIDDNKTLNLVSQLSSEPLPDDFLTQLERSEQLSIRAVGGDYVVPRLKFVRQGEDSQLILSERRYLDESGIRTLLEESEVDMPRRLKPEEIDECIKDLHKGLGLTATAGEPEVPQELLYRSDVYTVRPVGEPDRVVKLDESGMRAWLAERKFFSITTWISRY